MIKELIKLTNELSRRGLQEEADALGRIIKIQKNAASAFNMADHDLREGAKQSITKSVVDEAFRQARRDDIPSEMIGEFFADAEEQVAQLIDTITQSILSFKQGELEIEDWNRYMKEANESNDSSGLKNFIRNLSDSEARGLITSLSGNSGYGKSPEEIQEMLNILIALGRNKASYSDLNKLFPDQKFSI
jgi:hypothetical protein